MLPMSDAIDVIFESVRGDCFRNLVLICNDKGTSASSETKALYERDANWGVPIARLDVADRPVRGSACVRSSAALIPNVSCRLGWWIARLALPRALWAEPTWLRASPGCWIKLFRRLGLAGVLTRGVQAQPCPPRLGPAGSARVRLVAPGRSIAQHATKGDSVHAGEFL